MKKLVNSLKSWQAAWALALFVCTLFIAASPLAFSQVSFEKLWEVETPAFPIDPCFSKDGRFIYAASETNLMKFDAQTGQFISFLDRSAFPQMYQTIDMAISPKGTYLMSHDGSTGIYLWDTKTNKASRLIKNGGYGLIMTLDERQIIFAHNEGVPSDKPFASGNSNILIYDLEKDSIIQKIPSWGRNELLALSSDGKYLATIAYKNDSSGGNGFKPRQKVILWNTNTWIPEVIDDVSYEHGATLSSGWALHFSTNSKFISWAYTDKATAQFRSKIYEIENKHLLGISNADKACYAEIFLPDSQTYGFCYPEMEMFDLKTNEPKGKLNCPIYQWAINSEEKLLAAFDFTTGALYKLKSSSIKEEKQFELITAFYKDHKIFIKINEKQHYITPNISIYNINGKEILQWNEPYDQNTQIIIPFELAFGIYIVNIEINGKQYSTKLEVTR